jgi:hypothetical protein
MSPDLYPWMASKTPQTTKVIPNTLVISRTSNQNEMINDLKKGNDKLISINDNNLLFISNLLI